MLQGIRLFPMCDSCTFLCVAYVTARQYAILHCTVEMQAASYSVFHSYIYSIDPFVTRQQGCGISHKLTKKYTQFYSAKYYKHFIYSSIGQYYRSSVQIKNSSTEYKECTFKYLLSATLNCLFILKICETMW
jgi:hypothetical protein